MLWLLRVSADLGSAGAVVRVKERAGVSNRATIIRLVLTAVRQNLPFRYPPHRGRPKQDKRNDGFWKARECYANVRIYAHSGRLMPYKLGLRRVKNDQSTGNDSNSTEYELSLLASITLSSPMNDPSFFYAKASYSPHGVPRDLPQFGIPRFNVPCPFRAWNYGDYGS